MFTNMKTGVNLTSEVEAMKTNEFLRRRKLRLQQVREQSKDIAKKIRQRAKVEKLRHIVDLDAQKEREYLQRQEKVVKQLEELYAKSVQSVGAGHKNAADQNKELANPNLTNDLSRVRAREAAAVLRKEKEQRLKEHKVLLDRKLQARETANEISRDKTKSVLKPETQGVAKKKLEKSSFNREKQQQENVTNKDINPSSEPENLHEKVDMATQWNFDETPDEWNPVPKLNLPNDDASIKGSNDLAAMSSKCDLNKRMNLFALSEEMPSSLRGRVITDTIHDTVPKKTSLTIISEHLQNRNLRLRESQPLVTTKKNEDLQSIKQTIQQTRASKIEVKVPTTGKTPQPSTSESLPKNSVTIYSHTTRGTRDVPCGDHSLVIRDEPKEDAYSQAAKKTASAKKDREHEQRLQDMRTKIAMTRQNVEKEYNDTMSFLNSLPKERSSRTVRHAFMDESRQAQVQQSRQRRLQQEFNKIENECRRKSPVKPTTVNSRQKSPSKPMEEFTTDFQYSWLPVPEDDATMAVHTIPISTKEGKNNSVKFSNVDCYHEYRSRHKHTPPTKDRTEGRSQVEASEGEILVTDVDTSESSELQAEPPKRKTRSSDLDASDAERIIIYKIIDSKREKTKMKCRSKEAAKKSDEVRAAENVEDVHKTINEKGDATSMRFVEPNEECKCKCGSKKDISKAGPAVPVMQWECGDTAAAIGPQPEPQCVCKEKESIHYTTAQPSTSSSTSSFRTAAVDDQTKAGVAPGYVKVIDKAGKEAGNFYIGASGFLNNDNYEVVIQLRKKDVPNKVESGSKTDHIESNDQKVETIEIKSSPEDVTPDVITPDPVNTIPDVPLITEPVKTQKIEVPSTEPVIKPSISTYTQTTLTSPQQRPLLFHMSSSTSTAYMSPPEVVRPNCIKIDRANKEYEEREYGDRRSCRCKKCKHAKKIVLVTKFTDCEDTETNEDNERKKRENLKTKKSHSNHSKAAKARSIFTARYKSQRMIPNKKSVNAKSKLNPIIRNYVHRLLSLNKEGLKAIDVVSQECSSVTTPGSSIINVVENVDKNEATIQNKISLKQIEEILKQQIAQSLKSYDTDTFTQSTKSASHERNVKPKRSNTSMKKPVHKVKSLNISKNLFKDISAPQTSEAPKSSSSTSPKDVTEDKPQKPMTPARSFKARSKSSPTPRISEKREQHAGSTTSEPSNMKDSNQRQRKEKKAHTKACSKTSTTSNNQRNMPTNVRIPVSTDTGNSDFDNDILLMKYAENKYQNKDKIADMTEKCTQRLSNLVKLLDEVRRNKSQAYSQFSDRSSDTQQKSDKSLTDIRTDTDSGSKHDTHTTNEPSPDISIIHPVQSNQVDHNYTSLLDGIPKPETVLHSSAHTSPPRFLSSSDENNFSEDIVIKLRNKPPPALSRMNFKQGTESIIPHELSTVMEVDSPMSVKLKSQTTATEKSKSQDSMVKKNSKDNVSFEKKDAGEARPKQTMERSGSKSPPSENKTSEEVPTLQTQMMDLDKFNDIMLKPFLTLEEFAKQCNVEEISKLDEAPKTMVNDEISSLHSDGSLPDVIAELLKRNIISKPFTFDTESNVNTTTLSSASSQSALALSKLGQSKKKSTLIRVNKENIGETSDTLSVSSNPDLENAFKKLGLGWASSTLKKTREKLALSSSSNTSSSSSQNHKSKYFDKQSASVQLLELITKEAKKLDEEKEAHTSNNVEQQTSLSKSMTAKEFLTKELAHKITFGNRDESQEFVTLYETKMPEEMKQTSRLAREERSIDSSTGARARTSTPVQLFKSGVYHSSSSSNNASNCLFSNIDDLSSVKVTSSSFRNHSTSDKDDLTIPNYSLKLKKSSDASKSD